MKNLNLILIALFAFALTNCNTNSNVGQSDEKESDYAVEEEIIESIPQVQAEVIIPEELVPDANLDMSKIYGQWELDRSKVDSTVLELMGNEEIILVFDEAKQQLSYTMNKTTTVFDIRVEENIVSTYRNNQINNMIYVQSLSKKEMIIYPNYNSPGSILRLYYKKM